jgi:hypothetical protein
MDTLIAACLGIGLAAACGFRVFVPLLVVSVAARFGFVTLAGAAPPPPSSSRRSS